MPAVSDSPRATLASSPGFTFWSGPGGGVGPPIPLSVPCCPVYGTPDGGQFGTHGGGEPQPGAITAGASGGCAVGVGFAGAGFASGGSVEATARLFTEDSDGAGG